MSRVSIVWCPASFTEPVLEVPTHGELRIGHGGPLGQAPAELRVGTSADFGVDALPVSDNVTTPRCE